jgi:hypothetical protein
MTKGTVLSSSLSILSATGIVESIQLGEVYGMSLLVSDLHYKLAGRLPALEVRVCILSALRRERILLVHSDIDSPVGNELVYLPPIASHFLGLDQVSDDSKARWRQYIRDPIHGSKRTKDDRT